MKPSTPFHCLPMLWLAVHANAGQSAQPDAPARVPYVTGSHLQLVRTFFTTSNGLPADDIRAVTVTRDGIVLAAAGKSLARLGDAERWVSQTGPSEVTALFAPIRGP